MDSSVDVCDLMINLLCATCSDRACAENELDDQGEPIWSHSKLMDCIRKPIIEVAIHIHRVDAPHGVNDCDSFTTEGKGDIPDGYPMSCANCSNVADKVKCPHEPRIQIRTIKVGNTTTQPTYALGKWKVVHIIGRRAPP